MIRLREPNPVVCEVTIETPLVKAYMSRLEQMYGDPDNAKDAILKSFRPSEPEFGRGVVLVMKSGIRLATRHAEKIVAKVEASFSEGENADLAREGELSRAAVLRDAEAGF